MLRTLEKYELLEEIGHGGMATVYRARDTRLDRPVAVKVLHPHLQRAAEARSRFAREAKSVARLQHPNILEVYDYSGEDSAESYIASELLTGPTLKRFAEERGPMPAEIAACVCIELARALGVAHEHGVIHRDVKPENVLLHEDRCVKLTDFGIAQMVDSQSFTATGQILGSPGHMAPEQVEGRDCDARTDLFSLGTVLYYLAVGRLPFTGRNPHQVLKRIVDGDYADPLRVQPTIGGSLHRIIRKALASKPEDRYQSAEELETELERFVAHMGIEDPTGMLASFFQDPDGVRRRMHDQAIERLTALGEEALGADDVPTALDHFNRVLALDEGNERVLQLIERVGRSTSRRRRVVMMSGIVLGVTGIALAGVGYSLGGAGRSEARGDGRAGGVASASAAVAEAGTGRARVDAASGGAVAEAGSGGGAAEPPDASASPRDPRSRGPRAERPIGATASTAPVGGPRTVRFSPTPQNVLIGVDGSEPRPFGPSFREIELEPGEHTFEIRDGADCCKDRTITEVIPPGSEPYVFPVELEYADAGLYVTVHASDEVRVTVELADGRARKEIEAGTREVITVPMTDIDEVIRVRVTAPHHRAYTRRVRLRANEVEKLDVTLEALESAP